MANHKSAIKRHKQSLKRRDRNRDARLNIRDKVKQVRAAAAKGDQATAQKLAKEAEVALAKAVSKGLVHKLNAARRISRIYGAVGKSANAPAVAAKPKKSAAKSK